uniref:Speedy/RINGO cell cycle regulator family member A n=1 Tax=Ornithorhynchus anatinus TaxID=9258 RepID=A0A6I8N7S1_ORNAN
PPISLGELLSSHNVRRLASPPGKACGFKDPRTPDTLPSSTLEQSVTLAGRQPSQKKSKRCSSKKKQPASQPSTRSKSFRGAKHQQKEEEAGESSVVPHTSGSSKKSPPASQPSTRSRSVRGAQRQQKGEEAGGTSGVPHTSGSSKKKKPTASQPSTRSRSVRGAKRQQKEEEAGESSVVPRTSGSSKKNAPASQPSTRSRSLRGAQRQGKQEEAGGSLVVPQTSGYRPKSNIATGSPQPPLRKRKSQRAEKVDPLPVLPPRVPTLRENFEAFVHLMDDPLVLKFLAMDKYFVMSDKYMLAMVVAFFFRAGRPTWQYKRFHLFLGLSLANDVEQNVFVLKKIMLPFAFGHEVRMNERIIFCRLRLKFLEAIGGKARVSPEECEEIMALDPNYWVWHRDRILRCKPLSWWNRSSSVKYGSTENRGFR